MVSNATQLQILKSYVDFGNGEYGEDPKIQLHSVCVVQKESLPIHFVNNSLDSIIFNFFEMSTFFLVGSRNDEFQNDISDITDPAAKNNSSLLSKDGKSPQILFERVNINNGDDLTSQTLAFLQTGSPHKELSKYTVSQNHEFLAVYTKDNILLTYKIADLVFRDQQNGKVQNDVVVQQLDTEEAEDQSGEHNKSVNINDDITNEINIPVFAGGMMPE